MRSRRTFLITDVDDKEVFEGDRISFAVTTFIGDGSDEHEGEFVYDTETLGYRIVTDGGKKFSHRNVKNIKLVPRLQCRSFAGLFKLVKEGKVDEKHLEISTPTGVLSMNNTVYVKYRGFSVFEDTALSTTTLLRLMFPNTKIENYYTK